MVNLPELSTFLTLAAGGPLSLDFDIANKILCIYVKKLNNYYLLYEYNEVL